MSTFPTILSILLGLAFLGAGGTKLAGVDPHPAEFERFALPGLPPQTARLAVGAIEVLAALLLVIGAIAGSSGLATVGAAIALVAMVGALATHGRLGDAPDKFAPAGVLLVIAAVVIASA